MNNRFVISKNAILCFFESVLIMPFPYLTHFSFIATLLRALCFFALAFEILRIIIRWKASRDNRAVKVCSTVVLLFAFIAYQSLNIVFNNSMTVLGMFYLTARMFLLLLLLTRSFKSDYRILLEALCLYFWLGIFINFLSVIFFKNGLYTDYSANRIERYNYFLGVDNQFGKFIFPGFTLLWFRDKSLNKKFMSVSCLVFILATYFITNYCRYVLSTIC